MSKNDDEVLVRVDGVSKKFCRSLKKSLWYGVCDIASELNPFGRTAAFANPHKNLTTEDTESTEENTGVNQRPDSAEFLEGHSQAGLQMDSEKLASIRSANDSRASEGQTGLVEKSAKIGEICGENEGLRPGEFWAVKDVSFELRRGELRTPGRSEKEISKKCLGSTKVPDSGRRRHQCLGLIGHNGAGNQAAGQPLGPRQPGGCTGDCRKAARRVRRRGQARINSNRRLARRAQRQRAGASQMGRQKNHGGYSLREWSGLFANPLTSKLAVVFSKTRHPGKPGLPRAFSGCRLGRGERPVSSLVK